MYSTLCELQVRARRAQGGPRRRTGGGARAEAPDAGHARRRRARRGQHAPEAHSETGEDDRRLGVRRHASSSSEASRERAPRGTRGDWTAALTGLIGASSPLLKVFCFDGLMAHLPLAVPCAYMDLSPVSCRLSRFTLSCSTFSSFRKCMYCILITIISSLHVIKWTNTYEYQSREN